MKFIITFLLTFCSVCICQAEWFDSDTRYRLEVTTPSSSSVVRPSPAAHPTPSNKTLFIDLENKIFPASFENGVSVFSSDGKPIPFFFSNDKNRIFIDSNQKDTLLHIYFGFDKRKSFYKWDTKQKKPYQNENLKLTLRKLRITNEWQYFVNAKGLLTLAENTFNPVPNIQNIQKQRSKISELRNEVRKIDRERGKAKEKEKKDKLQKQKEKLEKQIDKLRIDFDKAEKKLPETVRNEKHYKRIWAHPLYTKIVSEINFGKKKFENIKKHETFGARFMGNLFIEKKGEYEFAINSADSSLLTIDDKIIVSFPSKHPKSKTWEKTATVNLKPGLHKLCFYYFKKAKDAFAEAAWKKAGEKEFKILKESDFAPAFPTKLKCVDKDKHLYPIVNYELNGYFLLEDGVKADWINCWVDENQTCSDLLWMSDETVVSKTNSSSFVQIRDAEEDLVLSSKQGTFDDIPIIISGKTSAKRYDPEIELKIWTPSFIYDTEILDTDIEMVSGLTRESNTLLKTSVSRPNCFLQDETRFITLKGKEKYSNARFSPPSRLKENIEIVGSELKNGLDATFYLMIPPIIFSKHSVRFMPITQCKDMTETVDGLVDSKGRRIIPILHRPDLAEKRIWSLSKKIVNELSLTKKLLLIADDFGESPNSFSESLKKRLATKKIELEFIPWTSPKLGSSIRGSIGNLVPAIQKSTADRILIIPPIKDINTGIPVRTQTRAIAALTQVAQSNKNIRVIYASSPFPSLRRTKLDNDLRKSIRKMSHEYNV